METLYGKNKRKRNDLQERRFRSQIPVSWSKDWGVIVLKPGEMMGCHGHNEVEETFYFIEGTPKMIVNDVPYEAKVGDAFRIEPLEKHDVHNDTDSPVKFVFIKCPYIPDDKITY